MPSKSDREHCRDVHLAITSANSELADALQQAAGLTDSQHPEMDLESTHHELMDAYGELRRALDTIEKARDSVDAEYGTTTPRQLVDDHADRIRERYDYPVRAVALKFLDRNRRTWLHAQRGTNGHTAVERHGLTDNQREWLNRLQEAWETFEEVENAE